MKCSKANEFMLRYFDANFEKADYEKLKRHLNDCEKCNEEFEFMTDIMLPGFEQEDAPEGFEGTVMKRIEEIDIKKHQVNTMIFTVAYNIAALISIAFILIFVVGRGALYNLIIEIWHNPELLVSAYAAVVDTAIKAYAVLLELYYTIGSISSITSTIIEALYPIIIAFCAMVLFFHRFYGTNFKRGEQ